jgi:hypothetical protein
MSLCQKLKNYIENACDGETHIKTAHLKHECNQPLNQFIRQKQMYNVSARVRVHKNET